MTPRPDHRLAFLLGVAHRRLVAWTQERAVATGVTAAQSGVLFALARDDGARIGDLADAQHLAPSAMTGLIDRMEAARLVERRPDEADARTARVWLTGPGALALERARATLADLNHLLRDGWSDAELETVSRWLEDLQRRFPRG